MIYRSSENRHSVGDRNRPVEIQCLRRDMALIVIQGEYAVKPSLCRLMEYGVCTDRSGYRISFRLQLLNSRHDFPNFLVTEQSVLAAVRI